MTFSRKWTTWVAVLGTLPTLLAFSETLATQPVDRYTMSPTDGFFGKTPVQGDVYVCRVVEIQPASSEYLPPPENETGRIVLKVESRLAGPDATTLVLPYHALTTAAMYDPVFHPPYWPGKVDPGQQFLIVVQRGKDDPSFGPLPGSDGYATDAILVQGVHDPVVEEAATVLRLDALNDSPEKKAAFQAASRDTSKPLLANYAALSIATKIASQDAKWSIGVLIANCADASARVYDKHVFACTLALLARNEPQSNVSAEQLSNFYKTLGTLVLAETPGAISLLARHLDDPEMPASRALWNGETINQMQKIAHAKNARSQAEGFAAAKVLAWLNVPDQR